MRCSVSRSIAWARRGGRPGRRPLVLAGGCHRGLLLVAVLLQDVFGHRARLRSDTRSSFGTTAHRPRRTQGPSTQAAGLTTAIPTTGPGRSSRKITQPLRSGAEEHSWSPISRSRARSRTSSSAHRNSGSTRSHDRPRSTAGRSFPSGTVAGETKTSGPRSAAGLPAT